MPLLWNLKRKRLLPIVWGEIKYLYLYFCLYLYLYLYLWNLKRKRLLPGSSEERSSGSKKAPHGLRRAIEKARYVDRCLLWSCLLRRWYVTSRSRLVINVFQRYHKLWRGTVHAFKDKRLQCLELQESVKDALRDVFEEMTSQKPSFTMARLQAL